jgi:hypothetical protein
MQPKASSGLIFMALAKEYLKRQPCAFALIDAEGTVDIESVGWVALSEGLREEVVRQCCGRFAESRRKHVEAFEASGYAVEVIRMAAPTWGDWMRLGVFVTPSSPAGQRQINKEETTVFAMD